MKSKTKTNNNASDYNTSSDARTVTCIEHRQPSVEYFYVQKNEVKLIITDFLAKYTDAKDVVPAILSVLSLGVTIASAQFEETLGLSPETIKTVCILSLILSIIYLICKLYKLFNAWNLNREYVIKQIENCAPIQPPPNESAANPNK